MIKLKTLLPEWISHAPSTNSSPDSKLRPTPGGMNDGSPNWNGFINGQKNEWFAYMEGNDWNKHQSGAIVYINEEGQKPHKIWIKIKTNGLRKDNDTNESHKERVRKHTQKVARSWMTAAKNIHNNPELTECGNVIPISWKTAFTEALNDSKIKSSLTQSGSEAIPPPDKI